MFLTDAIVQQFMGSGPGASFRESLVAACLPSRRVAR